MFSNSVAAQWHLREKVGDAWICQIICLYFKYFSYSLDFATETVRENFFDRLNGQLLYKAITVQYMWQIEDIKGAAIVLLVPVRELSIIVTRKKLSMPNSVD